MKILGFTEETNECDLCGKTELKGTFAVDDLQGNIYYLGSSCVKKRFGLSQKDFTEKKNEAKEERNEARRLFTLAEETKFNEMLAKYPNTSKYTPEAEGYDEFVAALKALRAKNEECDKVLPRLSFNQ